MEPMTKTMPEDNAPFCFHQYRAKPNWAQIVLSLYITFVFCQSLFYKFSDAPETQHIFGTLDGWAAGFGFPGLFISGGIFSAKVIGSFELISSILLILSLITQRAVLRVAGSLLSMGIITGAIFFHLFTPLGIVVQDDGGLLFIMACGVWLSAACILFLDRHYIFKTLGLRF